MRNDSAIFILTHGRPDKQLTFDLLQNIGYTGKLYLVLDDEDRSLDAYVKNYGEEHILIFNKDYYVAKTDTGNNNPMRKCGIYARNAIEDMAKDMELSVHVQADDDIKSFRYRYISDEQLKSTKITRNFDFLFESLCEGILDMSVACLGFSYPIRYAVGTEIFNQEFNRWGYAYNFIFRNGAFNVDWKMNFSDDFATPAYLSQRGIYSLQIPSIMIENSVQITNEGGMCDSYKQMNDFDLAWYIKMINPNSISINMGNELKVMRHTVNRPMIISGRWKVDAG